MADLIRHKDWAQTPLGPIEAWPQSLRTTVSLCLASNFPINIIWGPGHTQIYNAGYRELCGDAHPQALGASFPATWESAWPAVGEPFEKALAGDTTFLENQRMFLTRNGYLEETFFTFSLSPIRAEDGSIGGLFHPVTETTGTMLAARRTRVLRELSTALDTVSASRSLGAAVVQALQPFAFDLPMLMFYELDAQAQCYRLAAQHGLGDVAQRELAQLPLGTTEMAVPACLAAQPCGPYPEPATRVVALPIPAPGCTDAPALLVVAASPRLPCDESYRSFLQLLASSVAGLLQTVRALEDERRRAATLAEAEARLRRVFQGSYLFQGLVSPEGRVLDANATSLAAIAQPLSAVEGQLLWETPWFARTPGMPESVRERVQAAAAGQVVRQEVRLDLPVDGWREFDFTLRPVSDEDGRLAAIVCEAVEITDRKRVEAALREAQKLEAVGRLTGGVAHDFNNLMMVVAGGVAVLERQPDATRQRQALDGMRRAVQRGSALTQQLLTFGGSKALTPQPIDLPACLAGMQDLLNRTLGGQVRVVTHYAAGLWPIMADPNELEMVLLNLGVNARDAMPGGGTVSITAENVMDPRGLLPGDYVRIAVGDTGAGMEPAVRERAFEPFFTTKEVGQGSGVGLAQVYGFAKESGGMAEIDSAPGRGTTVTLVLPRSPKAVPAPIAHTAPPKPLAVKGQPRVLLVEDDNEVAELVAEMLEHLGYQTTRAGTAAEALFTLAHDSRIDLVFSDIMMPGKLTGVDLARRLRRDHPELPVVLTSGYAESFKNEAQNEGLLLLPKPYAMDELAAMVERALAAKVH